ncbi:MAG: DUF3429 domain-containing protein [Fulvimarina manganoxydans]|uniref:DUF3429 domain-containing protein n=1 Tax=Fulvimarina manganoxydans TaxID=937218 RepID=UPI0023523B24|nr:DUF3429 domain-containing protein [Fulvimarina manganoxydans]MCK5931824.1 DUF3429 domain-containing protein [Fulvimarina manganoxydans]
MSQTRLHDEPTSSTTDANALPIERRTAWALGLGGLIPFALLTAIIAYGGTSTIALPTITLALGAYSAAILSFLGGIRWGLAIAPNPRSQRHDLILSVLPSLLAWVLTLVPAPWIFAGFAGGFALQGAWDFVSARRGHIPPWFARLRLTLTIVVTLCQVLAFLRSWG